MTRREKLVALRLTEGGLAAVDRLAAEARVSRSEMMRRLLAFAVWKMPKGWKP